MPNFAGASRPSVSMFMKHLRHLFFLVLLCAGFTSLDAQTKKYTISGYVRDSSNGEAIIGATVMLKSPVSGTATNTYGFFSLTAEQGQYELSVMFIGMESYVANISLTKDTFVEVRLKT